MLDIFEEIKEIMKEDKEHNIRFDLDLSGLTVYLEYATDEYWDLSFIIPIKYDVLEECIHIPYQEFVEKYNEGAEIGITYEEIILIHRIMDWMNSHKNTINEICLWTDCENREQNEE